MLTTEHRVALEAFVAAVRSARDFKKSYRIRYGLLALGIQLKDTKNVSTGEIETTWEVKR